jgi:site-specific DNA-methyltransferase (adenine-specific)
VLKGKLTVHGGDALEVLKEFDADIIDAVVTDPPYGLTDMPAAKVVKALTTWIGGDRCHVPDGAGFMSERWDSFVPPPAVWDECLRVLKPGAHMFVFSGARTMDLMGLSIRLAGFEIRDTISWIRSDGMPKGQEVSRAMIRAGAPNDIAEQWKDWHSALKPAVEPIIVARKPLNGTLIANVAAHGTGALNIGDSRIAANVRPLREVRLNGEASKVFRNGKGSVAVGTTDLGRFPANVILDETAAAHLDKQTGTLTSGKPSADGHIRNDREKKGVFGNGKGLFTDAGDAGTLYGDSGGASRFFYCPKAPKSERIEIDGKFHPSVKPLTLMRYLVRLAVPENAVVLDLFAGSGTTGEACLLENRRAVLIEDNPDYLPLIKARASRTQTTKAR